MTSALALDGVSVSFGGVTALSDVSLKIDATPGVQAIIGPNGAGKTTLFNVLTGVVCPTKGQVFVGEENVTGTPEYQIFRRGVSRTFQGVRLFANLTAEQNVGIAARSTTGRDERRAGRVSPGWFNIASSRARTTAALDRVGLSEKTRNSKPSQLTLWERRMVEIARAISSQPDVLLLDEPAAGLNLAEKLRLGELIQQLARDLSCQVVVVEHDIRLVMSLAESVRVLNFGRILAHGTPAQVQADEQVREAYLGTSHVEVH